VKSVNDFHWFHCIDLGNGITTPGMFRVEDLHYYYPNLPQNLAGKSILDIGAWDGFNSFLAEKRGASRVVALDKWDTSQGDLGYFYDPSLVKTGPSKEPFDFAHDALHSKVESMQMSVYDINPKNVGMFDVVFMFGVYYHLKHPLLAFEKVRAICKEYALIEGHIDLQEVKTPACAFYDADQCNTDFSCWTGPNVPCMISWLKIAGFSNITLLSLEPMHSDFSIPNCARGFFKAEI